MLRSHVVEDRDAPANLSVKLAERPEGGATRGFHFLYRSSNMQLRTRDPRRLVQGLIAYLSSFLEPEVPDSVRVSGVGLVRNGGALVAPVNLQQLRSQVERRLNRQGIRFIDIPWLLVDSKRMEVVVPEPRLDVDWSQFDRVDELLGPAPADPPVPPGRYPLTGWAFLSTRDERLTRGQALAMSMRVTFGTEATQKRLDALANVMRSIQPIGVEWSTAGALANSISKAV